MLNKINSFKSNLNFILIQLNQKQSHRLQVLGVHHPFYHPWVVSPLPLELCLLPLVLLLAYPQKACHLHFI